MSENTATASPTTAPAPTALVPAQAAAPEPLPLARGFGDGALGYFTPLKADCEADQLVLYRALGQCDLTFDALIGQVVLLRTFVCWPVEVTNPETGEVSEGIRSVLILDDGKTVGCVSGGVLKALKALASIKGMGPWNPALRVQLRQIGLKGGKRFFTLDWLPPVEATPAQKGGNGRGTK